MDEPTISPAGDPFYARGRQDHDQDDQPHGCIAGVVYIGYEEDGEEHVEAVPCKRCKQA